MPSLKSLLTAAAGLYALALSPAAEAAAPGQEALATFRQEDPERDAVKNRFFTKTGRFEVAAVGGFVPNNPFSRRIVGGAILNYHVNETFGFEGAFTYSPDSGAADLKGLTRALVIIAHTGPGGTDFQQPLDKVVMGASFTAQWSPLYGKINLVGETVLNFDVYFSGGLGMVSKNNHFAVYNAGIEGFVEVTDATPFNEVRVGPVLGGGSNFFLTQGVALKLDARMALYFDNVPQYDADVPVSDHRLYNNFVVSGGLAFFFPKMKPRLYNF